jgi:signal transduction histidine kinase/CheY-like chemotaxis protein
MKPAPVLLSASATRVKKAKELYLRYDPDFILLWTVILVVLCFIPVIFNVPLIDHDSQLERSLKSHAALFVFGITIAACFSMIVDLILDFTSKAAHTRFFVSDRFLILITVGIVPVMFFSINPSSRREASLFMCLFTAQRVAIGAPLCRSFRLTPSRIFSKRFGLISFILFAVIQILIQYWGLRHNGMPYKVVVTVAWVIIACTFGYYLWYFRPYAAFIHQSYRNTGVGEDEYIPLTFSSLMLLLEVCLVLISTVGAQRYSDYNVALIGWENAVLVVTTVVATVLPGRIARSELADRERMIELKQNFVRYISHEIRTPINISLVGLEILEKNLQVACVEDDSMDVVKQIKDAITSATDVLNDLLTYEKITSNLMTLDRTLEIPMDIIIPAVNLFRIGAQSKDINLTVECSEELDYWMLTHAHLDIDKFKIIQIIRNFMSNALKFTPRGGDVTVKLSTFKHTEFEYSKMIGEEGSISHISYKLGLTSYHGHTSRKVAAASGDEDDKLSHRVHSVHSAHSIHTSGNMNSHSHNNSHGSHNPNSPGGANNNNGASTVSNPNLWLRICITDTGAGIAPQNIYKVFNQIIQFDANKLQAGKGSGLGLYISKSICDLHGGHVYVRSKGIGKGCAFYLELPLIENVSGTSSLPDIRHRSRNSSFDNNHPAPNAPDAVSYYILTVNTNNKDHSHQQHMTINGQTYNGSAADMAAYMGLHRTNSNGSNFGGYMKGGNSRIQSRNQSNRSLDVHGHSSNNNNNAGGGGGGDGDSAYESEYPDKLRSLPLEFGRLSQANTGRTEKLTDRADAPYRSVVNLGDLHRLSTMRTDTMHSDNTMSLKDTPHSYSDSNRATAVTFVDNANNKGSPSNSMDILDLSAMQDAGTTLFVKTNTLFANDTNKMMTSSVHDCSMTMPFATTGRDRDASSSSISSTSNRNLHAEASTSATVGSGSGNYPHQSSQIMHQRLSNSTQATVNTTGNNSYYFESPNTSNHGTSQESGMNSPANVSHSQQQVLQQLTNPAQLQLQSQGQQQPQAQHVTTTSPTQKLIRLNSSQLSAPHQHQHQHHYPHQHAHHGASYASAHSPQVARNPSMGSAQPSSSNASSAAVSRQSSGPNNEALKQLMLPNNDEPAPPNPTVTDETILNGKTLLVVDDSAINLKMVVLFFKKLGANVYQAHDGKEAVDIIKASLAQQQPQIPHPQSTSSHVGMLTTQAVKLLPSVSASFSTSFVGHRHLLHMTSSSNVNASLSSPAPSSSAAALGSCASGSSTPVANANLGSSSNDAGNSTPAAVLNISNTALAGTSANSNSTPASARTPGGTGQEPIDLVVMDNLMPIMNGPDAAKAMRELGYTGPIFGLTGHALRDDINHYIRCGADTVFKKPIDVKRFCRVFRNYTAGINIGSEIDAMNLD